MTRKGPYYGWVVVAVAFLTTSAALGTHGSWGVLLLALVDAFGWGRGLTAGAISLHAVVWGLSATPWGALFDRYGPRPVFAAAAVLGGMGLALAAATREPWQLYLSVGLLAGAGLAPLRTNSQSVVIANWFRRRRGLAVGIVAAGNGLGVLVMAPFTQWLVSQAGWQAAFLALGGLFVLGVAPLNALLQRGRPEELGLLPDGARALDPAAFVGGHPGPAAGPTVAVALRSGRFWALAVGFVLGAIPLQFLLAHAVAYIVDVGFARATAAGILGLGGAFTAVSMIMWGSLADRWGSERAYLLGSLALMASIGVLYLLGPGRAALLYVYALTFALGFGSRQGLMAFMAAALLHGRSFGALMGILAAHIALGSAIGPLVGGWLFDATGSYYPAFVVALASAAVSVGCIWLAAPRRGLVGRAAALGAAPAPEPLPSRRV